MPTVVPSRADTLTSNIKTALTRRVVVLDPFEPIVLINPRIGNCRPSELETKLVKLVNSLTDHSVGIQRILEIVRRRVAALALLAHPVQTTHGGSDNLAKNGNLALAYIDVSFFLTGRQRLIVPVMKTQPAMQAHGISSP